MKRRHKKNDDELNFWQPASDMFSALLLILMLVILLLGLYIVYIPEYRHIDPDYGDTYAYGENNNEEGGGYPTPTIIVWDVGGGEGEDSGSNPTLEPLPSITITPTISPTPTLSPTPTPEVIEGSAGAGGGEGGGEGQGEGPGDDPDAGLKSAVHVVIVDAETDRIIKEPDVEFELYDQEGILQILNTYYPQRITYRSYVTNEDGAFYFPEKLINNGYFLHDLTEPEGYDTAEDMFFLLDATYDWPDPLVVRVPMYPSRNIVKLQLTDARTGMGVSGAVFDVVAAENIITSDGTLRYRQGQVVSEITCGEDGYGESEEIYLGEYLLREREVPPYYASVEELRETSVAKKGRFSSPAENIMTERTRIIMNVVDELYPTRTIEGATFRVTADNGRAEPVEVTTNGSGTIILDSLEKGTTYRLRQIAASGSYQINGADQTIMVSLDGRIDGETETMFNFANRMIRVNIGITDEFSDVQVPNISLALYDSTGTLIRTWTTSGTPMSFTDLSPGSYYVIKGGDPNDRQDIQIRDTAEIQAITLYTTYVMHYVIMGAAAALGLIVIIFIFVMIRRIRKKRRQKREEEAETDEEKNDADESDNGNA